MKKESILTKDFEHCFLCHKKAQQTHHVMNAAYRKKSDKYGLIVPLCCECHRLVHDEPSQETNKRLKALAQAEFMMIYSYDVWMHEFHKNYM